MKKNFALILVLVLIFALCACGAQEAPATPTASPEATPEVTAEPEQPAAPPAGMSSTLPGAESSSEGEAETNEARELALSLVGESITALTDKIGEPSAKDYAPSCLGSGEDGELTFDGFTVYTYKTAESEIIQDVD